jgi:hypothetical protein
MNFYRHQERLVAVGHNDDKVKKYGGRREVLDVADDEQIIGCELEYFGQFFIGVTLLRWKISR